MVDFKEATSSAECNRDVSVSLAFRGNYTPNRNWACFVRFLKIIKHTVWETQKWNWDFTRNSGSWVIDQNMHKCILIVKGVLHLLPKMNMFVLYLKIINDFLENKLCML